MKCLLHIGTEKTGTTLLQDWLLENRDALGAQRVYLPTSLGKRDHRWFTAFFQTRPDDWTRAKGIKTAEDRARVFHGFADRFTAEMDQARQTHDLCIISSEHLHSRLENDDEIANIRQFLDGIFEQVTVLCYFRDQADMAVSLYSTALKAGHTATLDEFLTRTVTPKARYYDFKAIADSWSAVFGREQCQFRLYDCTWFEGGDLRLDFLSNLPLRLDPAGLSFATDRSNQSLTPLAAAACRAVNTHVPYWTETGISPRNLALKARLADLPALQGGTIDSPRKPALRALFADRNAAFLAQYFPKGTQLAASPAAPEPPLYSTAEVEVIVESALAAVLSEAQSALQDADAESLRDLAIRIEQGGPTTLQDAALLMNLALRARPNGPFIRKKAEAYAERLAKPKPALKAGSP